MPDWPCKTNVQRHNMFLHRTFAGQTISKEEQEANEKRWQESGGGVGSSDEW